MWLQAATSMKEPEMLSPSELPKAAFQARQTARLTQAEAAVHLGVSQPTVSKAENDATGRYVSLQMRMMQELAGWQVEGPLWRLLRG